VQTELDKYNESLDTALLDYVRGKEQTFDEHCIKFDLDKRIPHHELARRVAVMKMITARVNLPIWARSFAKQWLIDRGYLPWDDGDVPVEPKPKLNRER